MHKPQIKLISLQSKTPTMQPQSPPVNLHQQLQQAYGEIAHLKQQNRLLTQYLKAYQQKFEDFKIVQEQLQFRREQQRNMQQHLDHFEDVNHKLRARVQELEQTLRRKDNERINTIGSFLRESQICAQSRNAVNATDLHDSKHQGRKSIGEMQKENHPLTPKSRVNINLSNFIRSELDNGQQSKLKRKVFI